MPNQTSLGVDIMPKKRKKKNIKPSVSPLSKLLETVLKETLLFKKQNKDYPNDVLEEYQNESRRGK